MTHLGFVMIPRFQPPIYTSGALLLRGGMLRLLPREPFGHHESVDEIGALSSLEWIA